jgi:hypothetical protein
MQTSGDEMELFAAVNRRFRHIFAQQEHMKAFRIYDMVEVKLLTFLFILFFAKIINKQN